MLDDKRRNANNLAAQGIGMSLLKWAIFGLLMLPMAEIATFVAVALQIGFLAALALTVLTSLAGMAIIRNAGRGQIARMRGALGDRVITRLELDGPGFLTVLGGFLLLLPGFLTDIIGALLLLPITRRWIRATLRRALARAERASGRPPVVDLEPDQWRRVPEERIGRKPADRQRIDPPSPCGLGCVSHTADRERLAAIRKVCSGFGQIMRKGWR